MPSFVTTAAERAEMHAILDKLLENAEEDDDRTFAEAALAAMEVAYFERKKDELTTGAPLWDLPSLMRAADDSDDGHTFHYLTGFMPSEFDRVVDAVYPTTFERDQPLPLESRKKGPPRRVALAVLITRLRHDSSHAFLARTLGMPRRKIF